MVCCEAMEVESSKQVYYDLKTFPILVCVFEHKAQLLQWLFVFRPFNAIVPLFVHCALLP